jgi:hypothetical protein
MELHIDQLVLEGFPRLNRAELGMALQTELSCLLGERGLPRAQHEDQSHARVDGGSFHLNAPADAPALAAQIAQAIYGGLS